VIQAAVDAQCIPTSLERQCPVCSLSGLIKCTMVGHEYSYSDRIGHIRS